MCWVFVGLCGYDLCVFGLIIAARYVVCLLALRCLVIVVVLQFVWFCSLVLFNSVVGDFGYSC